MELEVGAKSDVGRKRSNNEDSFCLDAEIGLFIVADGMGGHRAGEVASELAVNEILKYLGGLQKEITTQDLVHATEEANRAIYIKSIENSAFCGMGTTVVVVKIAADQFRIAHVGDSRAYLFKEEKLERLTEDHSLVFQLVKKGMLSEKEARRHPKRGMILRAVGTDRYVDVDTKELSYRGETILLCTDGLTDILTDKEIEEVLKITPNPQEVCEALVDRANEAGGWDNITVLAIKGRER